MKSPILAAEASMRSAQSCATGLSRRRLLAGAAGVATASAIRLDVAAAATARAHPPVRANADEFDERRRRLAAILERHGAEFGDRS